MARKKHTAKFKAKVAVEAIKEDRTTVELSSIHGVHRNMIQKWKSDALTGMVDIFSIRSDKDRKRDQEVISELYQQNGQLTVENGWLKKNN